MKIAVIGAAGARTPLILQAMVAWQERIGLSELALMDVDGERLELIASLTAPLERSGRLKFSVRRTTDARAALAEADFVVTTFRVGGIESRVVDERVPLAYEVLGQETTGPGGFAMGMRTIPVLLETVDLMRQACPDAWLINFANPAGMLAEAVVRVARWERVVGICDAPQGMRRAAAALLGADPDQVFLDYFGLNHLGWVRAVVHDGRDHLPRLIERICEMMRHAGAIPGLPFHPDFIAGLGMIPNEYLYYYYRTDEAVQHLLSAGQTRGGWIAERNTRLLADLRRLRAAEDFDGLQAAYQAYLRQRGETYMAVETGVRYDLEGLGPAVAEAISAGGYAEVALRLIEALAGARPGEMILNVPSRGAIPGMAVDDVVEVPAYVGRGFIRPLAAGGVPDHCLGLMKQVKAYERLTIGAAAQGSYGKAVKALALHPLVPDYATARAILDAYREAHGALFPALD
jgi:6-phospho-beta-glucosidase